TLSCQYSALTFCILVPCCLRWCSHTRRHARRTRTTGAMMPRRYTQVAAAATVEREMSVARPALFATRPAIAAPKAIPSDWIVGMDDAVKILSPGRAAAMLQLLMCAKQI